MNIKPYIIIQHLRIDEYVPLSELVIKTGTSINTIRKQLSAVSEELEISGYKLRSNRNGLKLIRGKTKYLPFDAMILESQMATFIVLFLRYITDETPDIGMFRREYKKMHYTNRQMKYFFESRLNIQLSQFEKLSGFEHFMLFIEFCVKWFNCRNIVYIFKDIIEVEEFNNFLFSCEGHEEISPDEYITLYSIAVFDITNRQRLNDQYDILIKNLRSKNILPGLKYFKDRFIYRQENIVTNAISDYYFQINECSYTKSSLDTRYKQFDLLIYELAHLQAERTTKVVDTRKFTLTLIYEIDESKLGMIIATMKTNYPNVEILTVPSWKYLYKDVELKGIVFSNGYIDAKIAVIPVRDKEWNYDIL